MPKLPARSCLRLALFVTGLLLLTVPTSAGASIRGIDVSRFQGVIGWKQVGDTNLRFAFLQASRGSGGDCLVVPEECGADATYDRNYRSARNVGLRVGAYHRAFASGSKPEKARLDARVEADLFIESVGKVRTDDLRPALDVETPFANMTKKSLQAWIQAWLTRVEKKLGVDPIIYTNNSSWQATGNTTSFAEEGHPLWVANFDVPRPLVPAEDWAGRSWSIWQYTSSGKVRGIEGAVDKNRLAGGFRKIRAG